MPKEYYCKNVLEMDGEYKECGKNNPSDFEITRKSCCKDCKKILDNERNKARYKILKQVKIIEETRKKEIEITNKNIKNIFDCETDIMNLFIEVITFHYKLNNKYTIPQHIESIDESLSEHILQTFDKYEFFQNEINKLKNENKELRNEINEIKKLIIK